jgi:hypothetical protein
MSSQIAKKTCEIYESIMSHLTSDARIEKLIKRTYNLTGKRMSSRECAAFWANKRAKRMAKNEIKT